MKEKILVGMVVAMLPMYMAHGSVCYSDNGTEWHQITCGSVSEMENIHQNLYGFGYAEALDYCGDGNYDWGRGCLLSLSDFTMDMCVVSDGYDACDWCSWNSLIGEYSDWEDVGNNVVRRFFVDGTLIDERFYCDVEDLTYGYEYGCAEGYYQSSGSDANITCSRCPSSGGVYGTNKIGETSITTCYIPAGSMRTFTDDAGSGTEYNEDDCYYTN